MRRYGVRDDQWERIQDLLPGRVGHVGVTAKDNRAALHGSLRHPVSGHDPQEGDDEDADISFWWGRFGPGWAHVAPAQARYGAAYATGGRSGNTLAGAGRHRRDPDRVAGHVRGGR